MPIYEYQCQNCDHKFEELQKVGDKPLNICPKCNEPQLQKLVSAAGFHLKGDGWYKTDFKERKQSKPAAKDKCEGESKAGGGCCGECKCSKENKTEKD